MATPVSIVGWHLHPDAAVCDDCGASANYVCQLVDEQGYELDVRNLCKTCVNCDRYAVADDKIEEVFKNLGL